MADGAPADWSSSFAISFGNEQCGCQLRCFSPFPGFPRVGTKRRRLQSIQGRRPWDAELQIPRGKGHGASLPAPGCCGSPVRCTSASTPMQLPGAAAALANLQKAAGHCCLGRNINILITIKAISLICNVYQPPVTF